MAPLHRQNTSPLGKKSLDNDTPRDHNKPRATPATRAPGLVERARAAASSLFKESEEEDTGYRRPRLAGLYAEDLKHEDFTASYEVVKGDSELLSMVLVADGHGGPVTSSWLAENVLQIVGEECVDGTAKEVQAACIRAFSRAHEAVKGLKGPSRDGVEKSSPNNSGSTLTVLVFNHKRREITSANVGDSEALLAHDHGYEELSVSHRLADNPDEQERLTQKGISLGRAIDAEGWPGGPLRAWPGGLAVTRGIGDQDCEEIVSCLPSLKTVPAPSNGGVIVCCSDGVWDAVSLSEAAKMLSSFQFKSPASAAKKLVWKAINRVGKLDDVSASLLFFDAADPNAEVTFVTDRIVANRLDLYRPPTAADRKLVNAGKEYTKEYRKACLARMQAEYAARIDEMHSRPDVLDMSKHSSEGDDSSVHSGVMGVMLLDDKKLQGVLDVSNSGSSAMDASVHAMDGSSVHSGHSGMSDAAYLAALGTHNDDKIGGANPKSAGGDDSFKDDSVRAGNQYKGGGGFMATHASLADFEENERNYQEENNKREKTRRSNQDRSSHVSKDRRSSFVKTQDNAYVKESLVSNAGYKNNNQIGVLNRAEGSSSKRRGSDDESFTKGGTQPPSLSPGGGSVLPLGFGMDDGALRPFGRAHQMARKNSGQAHLRADEVSLWGVKRESAKVVEWSELESDSVHYLGQGEFAEAYSAVLNQEDVAVKVLKKKRRDEAPAVRGLKREIMVMSMIQHPNILAVVALGTQADGVPFVVLEKLHSVLDKQLPSAKGEQAPVWVKWREGKKWPLARALHMGLQLARGLHHCHDQALDGYRILHRDVKPSNIGWMPVPNGYSATQGRLVLFDFGLTCLWQRNNFWSDEQKPEREELRRLTGECGSLRYMAPEVACSRPYNHLAEVFAFGTVLWEMGAHRKPYANQDETTFRQALDRGVRPPMKEKWPEKLKSLLTDCWKHNPVERPEFAEIIERVESLLKDINTRDENILRDLQPSAPTSSKPATNQLI